MIARNRFSLMVAALVLLVLCAPAYAAKVDSDIEAAAKNTYAFKAYLKDDNIKVQSKDGMVVLTGSVASETNKNLAGETVANLDGVKSVDNRLEVEGGPLPESSDAWLLTKVKTTLLFHRSVSATTSVDVKDGVVTLRGDADNQAQKDLTSEYAADVEGVKSVKNEMVVIKSPKAPMMGSDKPMMGGDRSLGDKIDDATITALVKMTLLSHRSTSAIKTSVTTKNGVVTLGGTADNAAEKALAGKLAGDVKGVSSVDNNMVVK